MVNIAGVKFKKWDNTAIEEEMRQIRKDGLSFVTSRMYCTYVNRMKATKHSISAAKDSEHPRYVIHKRTSRCKPCGCKYRVLFLFAFFFIFINFKHVLTCRQEPVEKSVPNNCNIRKLISFLFWNLTTLQ